MPTLRDLVAAIDETIIQYKRAQAVGVPEDSSLKITELERKKSDLITGAVQIDHLSDADLQRYRTALDELKDATATEAALTGALTKVIGLAKQFFGRG